MQTGSGNKPGSSCAVEALKSKLYTPESTQMDSQASTSSTNTAPSLNLTISHSTIPCTSFSPHSTSRLNPKWHATKSSKLSKRASLSWLDACFFNNTNSLSKSLLKMASLLRSSTTTPLPSRDREVSDDISFTWQLKTLNLQFLPSQQVYMKIDKKKNHHNI